MSNIERLELLSNGYLEGHFKNQNPIKQSYTFKT